MEQWADSITAVLDDLGSHAAVLLTLVGSFATGALFAATHPSRTAALVVLEGFADTSGIPHLEDAIAAVVEMWGKGDYEYVVNPDMPWNEEIRATWARYERRSARLARERLCAIAKPNCANGIRVYQTARLRRHKKSPAGLSLPGSVGLSVSRPSSRSH